MDFRNEIHISSPEQGGGNAKNFPSPELLISSLYPSLLVIFRRARAVARKKKKQNTTLSTLCLMSFFFIQKTVSVIVAVPLEREKI